MSPGHLQSAVTDSGGVRTAHVYSEKRWLSSVIDRVLICLTRFVMVFLTVLAEMMSRRSAEAPLDLVQTSCSPAATLSVFLRSFINQGIKECHQNLTSCLFQVTVCNGKQDCSDGSDETCNMEKLEKEAVDDNLNIYNDQQRSAGTSNSKNLTTILTLFIFLPRIYS